MRSRRLHLRAAMGPLVLAALLFSSAPKKVLGFDLAEVARRAEELAQRPFEKPPPLPAVLERLNYDQYRLIAFRHERAIWRNAGLPFRVEFYHRGFVSKDRVDIFLVEDGTVRRCPFDPDFFQYRGELASLKPERDWGYAGFRLLNRLPTRTHFQEFCSFQGASYFRAICVDEVYGVSARGLAIDAGLGRPEEFPFFRAFWIERPKADAQSERVWALLDGLSVTGAYEFVITPGLHRTTLDIECRLFFRRAVERLGVAPFSSMWRGADAHDSDGLLIAAKNGEWLWRPFQRRPRVNVSQLQFPAIKGFGLMQRDRQAAHYRDHATHYEKRPSVWVEPKKAWDGGAVDLLEVPSDVEWTDNIAAWWTPKDPVRAGDRRTFAYRVAFMSADPAEHRGGRFVATSLDRRNDRDIGFDLTVDSGALRDLPADAPVQAVATTNHGRIVGVGCTKLPSGSWQVRFRLRRDDDRAAELRAYLKNGADVLSETWSFLCP